MKKDEPRTSPASSASNATANFLLACVGRAPTPLSHSVGHRAASTAAPISPLFMAMSTSAATLAPEPAPVPLLLLLSSPSMQPKSAIGAIVVFVDIKPLSQGSNISAGHATDGTRSRATSAVTKSFLNDAGNDDTCKTHVPRKCSTAVSSLPLPLPLPSPSPSPSPLPLPSLRIHILNNTPSNATEAAFFLLASFTTYAEANGSTLAIATRCFVL